MPGRPDAPALRGRRRRPERGRGRRLPPPHVPRRPRCARCSPSGATRRPTTRPYANRIFDPDAVDVYFDADDDVKRMLFDYHRNTNYSVVDADLIDELYRREYQERVHGRQRLRMMNASQVIAVDGRDDGVDVEVEHLPTGERDALPADAVVYATGYTPVDSGGAAGRGRRPGRAPARRRPRGPPRLPARARRPGRRRACTCRAAPSTRTALLDAAVQRRRPHRRDRRLGPDASGRRRASLPRGPSSARPPDEPGPPDLRGAARHLRPTPSSRTSATMTRPSVTRRLLVALVALTVALAACGSDDDDASAEGSGEEVPWAPRPRPATATAFPSRSSTPTARRRSRRRPRPS